MLVVMLTGTEQIFHVFKSYTYALSSLYLNFEIRQTFAALFENSLLLLFTLENTRPPLLYIYARNHPPFTLMYGIFSMIQTS